MQSIYSMLVVWITIGIICSLVAKSKGKNQYLWFAIGALFSVLGLLILLLLPGKKKEKVPNTGKTPEKSMNSEAAMPSGDDTFKSHSAPVLRIKPDLTHRWYYIHESEKLIEVRGPYSVDDLRKIFVNEKLPISTYIWCDVLADWTQLCEFQNMSYLTDKELILDNHKEDKDETEAKKEDENNTESSVDTPEPPKEVQKDSIEPPPSDTEHGPQNP